MGSPGFVSRSPKSANRTRRRRCADPSCRKPLGATHRLCFECGGENKGPGSAARMHLPPVLPGVTAALGSMFDRRAGDDG